MVTLSLWPPHSFATERQVVEVGITGMVCNFCVARVTKILQRLPGVESVEVSLQNEQASIVMGAGQQLPDPAEIRRIIEKAGFTPGVVQTRVPDK